MPFDNSGIFSLDNSNPVQANTVIEPNWANPTLADIADGLTRTLVRDGRAPMTGPLVLSGDAAAPLVATTLKQVQALIAAAQTPGLSLSDVYPIGSIYINKVNSANPLSILGFGTWVSLAGRVLVGYSSGDAVFGTAGATGGSKDATAVSHLHAVDIVSQGHSVGHTHTGTTSSGGAHSHTINTNGGVGASDYNAVAWPVNTGTASSSTTAIVAAAAHTHTMTTGQDSADHTHSVTGNTGSTGVSGTNGNLQPYLVAYMWERTA